MDAFSLSLIYGMNGIDKKDKINLSLIVGVYHFIMPLLGNLVGEFITRYLIINLSVVVGFIFLFIGLEMVISSIKGSNEELRFGIIGFLIFGLSVSIDSFTTGIGLDVINSNHLYVSFVFCVVSGLFTYLGLVFGNRLNSIFGKLSTLVGGFILIILGIIYFFK